jgi:2-oxoglutarate ferredoxin oxidoreductase subunit beta
LQPCVTFNKVNTFKWYQERVYKVEESADYDPENELWAYQKAKEWGKRIPIGVIYKNPRPIFEEAFAVVSEGPLARQEKERPISDLLQDFY